mgnify:CR=1 FL=1
MNPLDADSAPAAVLVSAFLSATLLPGASEITVLAALDAGVDPGLILLLATLGNTLGGMSSWLLGLLFSRVGRETVLRHARRRQALGLMQRWGWPFLLLSWAPVIGDALCLAAGWLRVNAVLAALAMAVGKGLRYLALIELYLWA